MTNEASFFVGIDWATEFHDVCIAGSDGDVIGERRFEHSSEGLATLCSWVREQSARLPSEICVAIELTNGPVVETLLDHGFAVFAINPKQLDRFRDRFTMAGAKDDRLDAHVLASSIRTDAHSFRRIELDDPYIVRLREWSRIGYELQQERVKVANRSREQLRRYFPQFLSFTDDITANWVLELWRRFPTPMVARRAREVTVAKILSKHRIRKITAKQVLEAFREPALTVAPGVVEAATAHLAMLNERAGILNDQLKRSRAEAKRVLGDIEGLDNDATGTGGQRDVAIILSLPGIGPITGATLLAEASRALRNRDYRAIRSLSGVAPVTRRSGRRKPTVVMRYACSKRLRNAMYYISGAAVQRDPACKARYAALRAKGHGYARALRSIADRLLRILMAMLRSQTTYVVSEGVAA